MIPRTHILVVSFHRDFEFFQYMVRSYKKFCKGGFTGITVVVPHQDEALFRPFCEAHGVILRSYFEARGKEFLHHQVIKCEAELWVPDGTEVVAHMDSDCFYHKPFHADCYFFDGKPRITKEPYADFEWYPARYSWKRCVDYALGGDHQWETMTQHPELYWIDHYRRMRDHIEARHHFPYTQFILLQRNEFPQTFAEFPTMGAFAIAYDSDRYQHIIDLHHPGKFWANPKWKKFGIEPREWTMATRDNANQDRIQGWSSKALWEYPDGNGGIEYRDLPIFNPVTQYWSHGGTSAYRKHMEELLA